MNMLLFGSILTFAVAVIALINSWTKSSESDHKTKNMTALILFGIAIVGLVMSFASGKSAQSKQARTDSLNQQLQMTLLSKNDSIKRLALMNYDLLKQQYDSTTLILSKANKSLYPLPDSFRISFEIRLYNEAYIKAIENAVPERSRRNGLIFMSPYLLDTYSAYMDYGDKLNAEIKRLNLILSNFHIDVKLQKSSDAIGFLDLKIEKDFYKYKNDGNYNLFVTHTANDPYIVLNIQNMPIPIITKNDSITSLADIPNSFVRISFDHSDKLNTDTASDLRVTQTLSWFSIQTGKINFKPIFKFREDSSIFVGRISN